MWLTFAIRFDSAKNAAMAPMSQMSSSSKPWRAEPLEIGVADLGRRGRDLAGEVEHRLLAIGDIGLAVVDGDLVGDQRILLVDPQDGAVRDDAVQAVVQRARGDDDHLALGLGERARRFSISAS